MATPDQPPPEHEFDANENEVFSGLAGAMTFVAIVMIIAGSLVALTGVLSLLVPVAAFLTIGKGVLLAVLGGWTVTAAGGFRSVATTEGNDLTHLMSAIRKLRNVFVLQSWLLGIVIALGVIGFIYAVVIKGG